MDKKLFGDSYKSLPVDPSQELPDFELQFLDNIRSKKKLEPPKLQKQDDSDDESDNDSDASEVHDKVEYNGENEQSSSTSVLKSTLISSILFLLLSNDMVDKLIRTTGLDGMKILFAKVFIFAVLFFIIAYKFS